ncbi:MAG: HAD-IC family P-type ATPase, partial [Mangrovicoccus sp.]
ATGDWRVALNIAAAVLIITCPCALGLAVPAVTTAASGRLFKRGLLIKSPTALERLAEADCVVFDKTGTLTLGVPELENFADLTPEAQSIALAMAQGSAHPLSQAILRARADAGAEVEAGPETGQGIAAASVRDLREIAGDGVEAWLKGDRIRLGRADWVGGGAVDMDTTCSWLRIGEAPAIALRFSDQPRPGAAETVAAMREAGLPVYLFSGDSAPAVQTMAARLGIENWRAGMRPAEKAAEIARLSEAGHKVLMMGDGLNDTAALAAAHVSVSPASALEAARVASDIVLLHADLSALAEAQGLAGRATKRIRENFQIATAYNVIAVPLAIAGLATPLIAALAMSASSITVSLNALRVR